MYNLSNACVATVQAPVIITNIILVKFKTPVFNCSELIDFYFERAMTLLEQSSMLLNLELLYTQ